ncbi:MAG: hypothetical protein K940chlam5_00846 [Candidatus Anoxychlamydiales bacterium]|nr:hypothetical protein [Candidatus Anoxychlamydiales bacterium]
MLKIIYPASFLEDIAFNKKNQPKTNILKETTARIVALVAPLLFAYQTTFLFFIGIVDFLAPRISKPFQYKKDFSRSFNFAKSLLSATLEIPEKLFYGSKSSPNYLKILNRYDFEKLKTDLTLDSMDFLGIVR